MFLDVFYGVLEMEDRREGMQAFRRRRQLTFSGR